MCIYIYISWWNHHVNWAHLFSQAGALQRVRSSEGGAEEAVRGARAHRRLPMVRSLGGPGQRWWENHGKTMGKAWWYSLIHTKFDENWGIMTSGNDITRKKEEQQEIGIESATMGAHFGTTLVNVAPCWLVFILPVIMSLANDMTFSGWAAQNSSRVMNPGLVEN